MMFTKEPKVVGIESVPNEHVLTDEVKRKTIILVPVGSHIEPACDESLRQLEKDGIKVYRKYGFSAIDQGRCVMAQQAIDEDYEHLFWIDSDIAFHPTDIYKIINRNIIFGGAYPFVTGAYTVKGWPALTTKFLDGYDKIFFGRHGALYEVEYAATGFMYTHVSVYENIKIQYDMNPVKIWGGQYTVHPWFLPMIIGEDYVGEDFAFCHRAKKSGVTIYCDTTIRLAHIGKYSYSFDFLSRPAPTKEPENIIFYNESEPRPADIY
jgi:hypothetical protein